jgi:hypothetical protein
VKGVSKLRTALSAGVATGAAASAQEGVLQGTQETRQRIERVANVGVATLLSSAMAMEARSESAGFVPELRGYTGLRSTSMRLYGLPKLMQSHCEMRSVQSPRSMSA